MLMSTHDINLSLEQNRSHAKNLLDQYFPLANGYSHTDVKGYCIYYRHLMAILKNGRCEGLTIPSQLKQFDGDENRPERILLANNNMEIELYFDPRGQRGKQDNADIENISIKTLIA